MLAYHALFVALVVGTELFFAGLSIVNVRYGARTARERADWMRETLGVEDVAAVLDYQRARVGLSLLETATTLGFLLLALYSGLVTDVVVALTETVREEPTTGRLLLGFVAAVGLGPGAHNVLLFSVAA